MDRLERYGIKAGVTCVLIMLVSLIVLVAGFLFMREQFAWFVILYMGLCILSFLLAGFLSGIYSSGSVNKASESVRPGLVAGAVTAAIPAALCCVLIVFAIFAGREQFAWALIGLRFLATLIFMVMISALVSAACIFVARKGTITIKFNE